METLLLHCCFLFKAGRVGEMNLFAFSISLEGQQERITSGG